MCIWFNRGIYFEFIINFGYIFVGTHTVPHSIARDAIHSLTYSLLYHSLFFKHRIAHLLGIALETENDRMKNNHFIKMYDCPFIQAKQSNNPSHRNLP